MFCCLTVNIQKLTFETDDNWEYGMKDLKKLKWKSVLGKNYINGKKYKNKS